jgi:hypothetical protein
MRCSSKHCENINRPRGEEVVDDMAVAWRNVFLESDILQLLTPYSTVLLEKLTGFAANQQIPPHFMEPRKFIIILSSTRHLSLSCANSTQSPTTPFQLPEDLY